MKLPELKTRLKNKYVVRIVAGVLTIALLGSSMTADISTPSREYPTARPVVLKKCPALSPCTLMKYSTG